MARNKQEDRLSALVRSTERDTWEKGQQAGRWLSQHMYSEKEKREMEKKRRAQQRKAQAQAAQPESAPEESAPGGAAFQAGQTGAGQQGQKPTPATGVSAQQNAAWQAAADGDGQAPAEQGMQSGEAADADWHTPFRQMEFAPSMQANLDALDSLKPVTQSLSAELENVNTQLNSMRAMNPMYITNIAEYNQSCQALQQRQAYLSEQLEEAQAAEQAMRQEYQAATMTPADRLRKQFQAQQQAVAQARKDGRSQSEIAALEAQKNETYQSYLAAWNEENQAQAALFAARRTPGTTSEEIQRLERVLESEKALAAQAGQAEQQARQAAQAQQTAASSQTQQELDDVNSRIWELESTNMMYTADASMAYTPEYLALLEKRERLKSQLSAQKEQEVQQVQSTMSWGTLEAWAQPGYTMSETEKAAARAALKEWNGVIGPDFDAYYEAARALREMGQSTKEIEILLYQAEIMDTLATKVSGVRSAFSGAGNALPLVPQVRGALEAENWRRAGFEGENPLGVAQRSQSAAGQNPVQYGLGYGLSSAAQYALAGRLMQAVPGVSGALDDVANAIAATGPAQKLQTVPVLGQLATPEAIRGMAADAMLDFGLGTVPQAIEQAGSYARQLTQGVRPGEQVLTPGSIWGNALQNTGAGLLANAAGELAPAGLGALDSVLHGQPVLNAAQQQGFEAIRQGLAPSANQQAALHSLWGEAPGYVPVQQSGWDEFLSAPAAAGTAQDAAEAAQRQAFLKWTQGEAMTAQEKQLVDDLWNTDPAKASEYWAAGEFLDTEVPGASSLDGGGFDGTMKSEAAASPTGQRTPFDYLQDGKGWEEPSETVNRANIAAFENGEKTFNDVVDDYAILYAEKVNSNRTWRWKEISNAHLTRPQKRKVNQRAVELGKIPEVLKKPGTNYLDFERSGLIYKIDGKPVIFSLPQECWQWSDDHQFALLDSWLPGGKRPEGYMWHHSEQTDRMELVPFGIHNVTSHVGGRASGMWAAGKR